MEYEICIPEQLGEYTVLKLTLQPLVENALYHGIKNKRGKGKITVCGHKDGQLLELRVRDNGIGICPDQLSKLRNSIYSGNKVGFGLTNVHERIQLYYGKEYGLRINSEYGVGTEVTIRLPAKIIQPVS
jgi:two-component system sensor histidine kinase YesM